MSLASSRESSYFIGIEKIRFLYLSMRADQASSLALMHSFTSRSSDQASSSVHSSLVAVWLIGWARKADACCKAPLYSTARRVQARQDGSYRSRSLRLPERRVSPE